MPVPISTMDGRLFADGMVVMTLMDGERPETEADWRRVAETLRRLHGSTKGWPQRPGWRSSTDLLNVTTGRRSTSGRCPLKALLDAGQRGRGSLVVRHAWSTATPPILATSA